MLTLEKIQDIWEQLHGEDAPHRDDIAIWAMDLIEDLKVVREALKETSDVINNILTDSQLDVRTKCGLTIREWSVKVKAALADAEGKEKV